MSDRMSKAQKQRKALLDAIEFHDKGRMMSDLVTRMVNSSPNISRQRRYIAFLIEEINNIYLLMYQSGSRHLMLWN